MITKKNKANLFLFCIFLSTLLFYTYFIKTNKGSIQINNSDIQTSDVENLDKNIGITRFSNVEYKTNRKNKDYITRGKEAYVLKDQPDLIELSIVHSFTVLKDGSILNIKSNKARYQKSTKNIYYYKNVIITNKQKILYADTANFLANKNLIELSKVVYKDGENLLKGDLAKLDTITNDLEIFMENKKDKVYGQRRKN